MINRILFKKIFGNYNLNVVLHPEDSEINTSKSHISCISMSQRIRVELSFVQVIRNRNRVGTFFLPHYVNKTTNMQQILERTSH
jgi:hypothetical protein